MLIVITTTHSLFWLLLTIVTINPMLTVISTTYLFWVLLDQLLMLIIVTINPMSTVISTTYLFWVLLDQLLMLIIVTITQCGLLTLLSVIQRRLNHLRSLLWLLPNVSLTVNINHSPF
jgi:hypothetical protein